MTRSDHLTPRQQRLLKSIARAWLLLAGLLACSLLGGCQMGPSSPSEVGSLPITLNVSWTSDVPDAPMHEALNRLEKAAGGLLKIQRQSSDPSNHVKLYVDEAQIASVSERQKQNVAAFALYEIQTVCRGEVVLTEIASHYPQVILHEIGHILISYKHSPYQGDLMNDGWLDQGFSPRESKVLQENLQKGCTRIEVWP